MTWSASSAFTTYPNVLAFAETIRATGQIFAPFGDAEIAMIDRRDLAAVAAVTLTESEHDGRTVPSRNPKRSPTTQMATRLSTVLGTPVEYVDVPDEAALVATLRAGAPDWLGHEPHGFADFAAAFR